MTPFKSFLDFIKSNPISNHSSRVIGNWDNRPRYKGTVSPSVMTYGAQTLNSQSALQTAVVTNVGAFGLPIESITSVGDWIVSNNCPAVLQPGETCQISAVFNPKRAGLHTGGIYVNTGDAAGTEFVQLIGTGSGTIIDPPIETLPSLAISDATITAGVVEPPAVVGSASIMNYPSGTTPLTTFAFTGSTEVGAAPSTILRIVSTGTTTYASLPISNPDFTLTYGPLNAPVVAPQTLTDGQALQVNITFNPPTPGTKSRSITFSPTGGTPVSITLSGTAVSAPVVPVGKDIALYFPNEALLVDGLNYQIADLPIDNIKTINYSFFTVASNGTVGYPLIAGAPQPDATALAGIAALTALKTSGKVFNLSMSLGGGGNSANFASAVASANRPAFVTSILAMLGTHTVFNGVDIDWEYPATTQEEADLVSFITLLRQQLNSSGRAGFKISIALTANHNNILASISTIGTLVDKIYLMTYDFADGAWPGNTTTVHAAALYKSGPSQFSADTAVQAYLTAGVAAAKLHIGVAGFSRGFANTNGLHQAASGGSTDYDPIYLPAQVGPRYRLMPLVGATEYWDNVAQATYSYDGTKRVFNSYDSVKSVEAKCDYVTLNGLGGIMLWNAVADLPVSSPRSLVSAMHKKLVLNETPPLARITISGNQFMRNGVPFRIEAVNWAGFESNTLCVHGLWKRNWKSMMTDLVAMGFNAIRLPFSREGFSQVRTPTDLGALGVGQGPGATDLNPDWMGKTNFELFTMFIDECTERGLYVLLDHHCNNYGTLDGTPTTVYWDKPGWLALWGEMAKRYGHNTTIIGADLYNEPHNVAWSTLRTDFQDCGNHIHTIAPDWLIFCGGGADGANQFWWGGNLDAVGTQPVVLTLPNKVAYTPHEYGHSVGGQSWLATTGNTPANWPLNLNTKRRTVWSYIFENNIAPVLVGEFGGKFGWNNNGTASGDANAPFERQWLRNLIDHMNGDFDGDGTYELTGNQVGMSYAYWTFNANSGDTGGLLIDDATWTLPFTEKLTLLEPLFTPPATDMIDPPGTYGVLMTGGQSNMDQHFGSLSQNAEGRSYQKIIDGVTTALGRSPGDITIVNGATGGSAAEYRARPSWFPTGYWWDSVAGTPGPMLTAWEAKYAALPNGTNIIGVIWAQGEADVSANSADVATSTPAMFKAALQSIFARMRTVVGNPNLKIWIQPLAISYWNYGANGLDIIGGIYEAYRDQQLAIAYEQANTHIGAWVPDITYGGFVQEYDNGTPIAGRIHYTPTNYHALGTKLGQAIGNNADQIELRPAWANLRAGTNITAQFDASNNITITWTARPGISEWHIINSKLDGSGFWSQGNVTTNSFTYTAAQQTADYGFAGVMVGFYVAEYSNSTVGSHGRFVGAPTAYSGGGGGG